MLNVIFFSLIGGLFSLLGASLLFRSKKRATKLVEYATPFAAGILLAAAFTDFLPEAVEQADSRRVLLFALLGLLGFFMLERFVRWFHHHHEHKKKDRSNNSLIIIGDTLHNALDGVAIGAAFLIDVPTGVVASIAVAAHEIPQEIGDFGLLLRNGMEKRKVIIVNVLSALATTVTAVLVYALGDGDSTVIPYLLALTAGFFVYIATSDIIPEIHETGKKRDIRPWLLLLGALTIMIISPLAHEYIDAGHDHEHSNGSHAEDKDDHTHDEDKEAHHHEEVEKHAEDTHHDEAHEEDEHEHHHDE